MTTLPDYDDYDTFGQEAAPLFVALAHRYATEEAIAVALTYADATAENGAFVVKLWRIVRAGLIARGEIVPPVDC